MKSFLRDDSDERNEPSESDERRNSRITVTSIYLTNSLTCFLASFGFFPSAPPPSFTSPARCVPVLVCFSLAMQLIVVSFVSRAISYLPHPSLPSRPTLPPAPCHPSKAASSC